MACHAFGSRDTFALGVGCSTFWDGVSLPKCLVRARVPCMFSCQAARNSGRLWIRR